MEPAIRTRFAPSPTGYMHIGNLRTALYAFLIARSKNGTFILRIEDTDRDRFVEGSIEVIYDTLRTTGLNWDEGPIVGGEYGPYIQSERKDSYLRYAKELIEKNHAYYCFCTKERLAELKENNENSMYDGCCLNLSEEQIKTNLADAIPYVVRQKMPKTGKTVYKDLVYGIVEILNSELEDQILIKSDGHPTYNFANVIDDHLMHVTHIVRGNEYLVSTPKYNLLYDSFGWEAPKYIHLPLIMSSSTEKLSKRSGSASYQDLVKEGFLPHAIINYIALLGWSPGTTQELFSLDELISQFDIAHINKAPSIFDKNKLAWMNGEYLKMTSAEEFFELSLPYLKKCIKTDLDLKKISSLLHSRILVLSEIEDMVDFFNEVPDHDIEIYTHKKMKTDRSISLDSLKLTYDVLKDQVDFSNDGLFETLKELASSVGLKNSQILWPLRTALTGKVSSPGGATEVAQILCKEETLKRIKAAIALLTV